MIRTLTTALLAASVSIPAFAGIESIPEGGEEFLFRLECNTSYPNTIRVFSTEQEDSYLVDIDGGLYTFETQIKEQSGVDEYWILSSVDSIGQIAVPLVLGVQWHWDDLDPTNRSRTVVNAAIENRWTGTEHTCQQVAIRS